MSQRVLPAVICTLGLLGTLRTFVVTPFGRTGSAHLRATAAQRDTPESNTAAGDGVQLAAGASLALAAVVLAGTRRRDAAKARKLVVAHDGSSWGDNSYGASTSLDSSGKLPFVTLKRGNDEATVYLCGGCVTSYKTGGTEWLALRSDAVMDGSKPISGGLPICWPQFGPGEIQQHGFARNLSWRLLEEPSEAGVCVLELTDSEATRKMWPHAFRLEYRVELKDDRLCTTFTVENTSASAFSFNGALHSYYAVNDVNSCQIIGKFKDSTKLDKTQAPPKLGRGDSDTVTISKKTEEIYKEVLPGTVVLKDPSKGELEIVSGGGWRDVVVWNPYGDQKMGYSGFVCVESAEIASVPLAPKATWQATMDLVAKKA